MSRNKDFLDDVARLEVADLLSYRLQQVRYRVPLRFGSRRLGYVRVDCHSKTSVVLQWDGFSGEQEEQIFVKSEFKAEGRNLICLRCPGCKKLRQRLFLVNKASTLFCRLADHFSFVCIECVPAVTTHQNRGRQPRKRARAHDGADNMRNQRPKWWVEPGGNSNSRTTP